MLLSKDQLTRSTNHVFDFRRRQANRAYHLLERRYGVVTRVYFPLELESHRTGSDDLISYPECPSVELKTLIPSLYKEGAMPSVVLDSLIEDEEWMYSKHDRSFPLYSFLEVVNPHTQSVSNFKVDFVDTTIKSLPLWRAYKIVPAVVRNSKNPLLASIPDAFPDNPDDPTDFGSNPYNLSGNPHEFTDYTDDVGQHSGTLGDLPLDVDDGYSRRGRTLRPLTSEKKDD